MQAQVCTTALQEPFFFFPAWRVMNLIHNSPRGFTSRADSQTTNSVIILKGRSLLQEKKAKVLLSVRAHRAVCNAVWRCPSSSAPAALCCRSRAFTIGHFTLKDSLMGFAALDLFKMLLCKPTSLQMKQWWVCSALLLFGFLTGMLPPEFLSPATANRFCWYFTLTNHFWKFRSKKSALLSWGESWESAEECLNTSRELMRNWNVLCVFSCYL